MLNFHYIISSFLDKLETMEGKGHNTSVVLKNLKAEQAELYDMKAEKRHKVEEAEAAVAEKSAWIKNLREDYQRKCQFDEQLETLQKNLGTTTLAPMEVTGAVQKCYQDAKD